MGNIFLIKSGGGSLSAHQILPGNVLVERYRILNFLAAGGMQDVYVCFDMALDRQVVLKTPKQGIQDRRFKRGAEMGARINHPNVAATFDYFEDDSSTFMIEEYIEGQDLGKLLSSVFFFMDPSLAAHVIHHIARALHEAHRADICHRDLKPSNIMASSNAGLDVIKLTDFGIAKLAENEIATEMENFNKDSSTLTSSNTLLGAVPYMAPECWSNWTDAGQPMDVWALGCIGYQLLTGKLPFGSGRDAIAKVVRAEQLGVKLDKPTWFDKHPNTKQLEQELWSIIEACIQVDPVSRPTAEEVIEKCDNLCYSSITRQIGTVEKFPLKYPNGGTAYGGFVVDNLTHQSGYFHGTDFYGDVQPTSGQHINFSAYPGTPNPRCSPVLLVR